MTVNELIQTACEDASLVSDGETVTGDLAQSCEGLLNRAITSLNQDGYMSLTVREYEVTAAGRVLFHLLEPGESLGNNVNATPPDSVKGVARKVGIRWMRLRGASPEDLASCNTASLPQLYSYSLDTEGTPSGKGRTVGILKLNGYAPVQLKIFVNSSIYKYHIGDSIYLPDLYHDLILYALEVNICKKYKLYSYIEQAERDLSGAKDLIDRNTLQNRPLTNIDDGCGGYMDDYYNGLGGVGL